MRRFAALIVMLACTAASPPTAPLDFDEPQATSDGETVCRDRIHTVRQERGLPAMERETADPEEPLLIAAVDHRIDGCSVMVMKYDSRDVRPIPKPDDGAPLLRRIQ
ncbi:MAG: hypothetical protein ACO1OD_08765 [Croceibacterium sp.]